QINLTEAKDTDRSNNNAVATMYPFLIDTSHCSNSPTTTCQTSSTCTGGGTCVNEQASLNLDDIVSVSTLYPKATFSTNFGKITGSILLPNKEGAMQGAYVIARQVGNPRINAVGNVSGARFVPTEPGGPPSPTLRAFYELPGLPPGSYTVEIESIDPT